MKIDIFLNGNNDALHYLPFSLPRNLFQSLKACVVLHNFIMQNHNADGKYLNASSVQREDENGDILQGIWEQDHTQNALYRLNFLT